MEQIVASRVLSLSKSRKVLELNDKYIIVTGGQFANKGAQALTFVVADEIAKRWPQCTMIMYNRAGPDRNDYKFKCISDSRSIIHHSKEYRRVLENAEAIIDISGYALSSEWSIKGNLFYIKNRLIDAQKYNIPVYLMSQSFGPFKYKGVAKPILMLLLQKCLPYAKLIVAREEEGKELLESTLKLTNVINSPDVVLQSRDICINNVFENTEFLQSTPKIDRKAVALIPNFNICRHIDINVMLSLYDILIDRLNTLGYRVYIMHHSSKDIDICESIYERSSSKDVVLIVEEYNCYEFEQIVRQMSFIVASRYHSIVHGYKNRVPAIILSWTTKYMALAKLVEQEKYVEDLHKDVTVKRIIKLIDSMDLNLDINREKINVNMNAIQQENTFELIKLKSDIINGR